jgi:hypothetical protein
MTLERGMTWDKERLCDMPRREGNGNDHQGLCPELHESVPRRLTCAELG